MRHTDQDVRDALQALSKSDAALIEYIDNRFDGSSPAKSLEPLTRAFLMAARAAHKLEDALGAAGGLHDEVAIVKYPSPHKHCDVGCDECEGCPDVILTEPVGVFDV